MPTSQDWTSKTYMDVIATRDPRVEMGPVTMDFVSGLPKTWQNQDTIWVIVDRLTKTAHFILVNTTYTTNKLAELYVQNIVKFHRVPQSIVSDRDSCFTSKFWKGLQTALGIRLKFSTVYHPQTDGQSERTIQNLEDMLRACALDFRRTWEISLSLTEIVYNNNYHATIEMSSYEALYERKFSSTVHWDEAGERKYLSPELVEHATEAIKNIWQRMKTDQSQHKSYADKRRNPLEFEVGDKVFLKTSPVRGIVRFHNNGKLSPRYIGPSKFSTKLEKWLTNWRYSLQWLQYMTCSMCPWWERI